MIAVALWLAALCGLIVAAAIATARARAKPDAMIERGWFVALALVHVALVAGAAWTWGGERALDARDDRLHAGAQVALELREIDVPVAAPVAIGHARDATVRLPGAGADVIARIAPGPGHTAFVTPACPGPGGSDQTFALPPGATVPLADCGATASALAVRYDGARLAIAPARGARTFATAGDVLRIGRTDEPIPGLASWELPAAGSELVAIPSDPSACADWPGGGTRDAAGACTLALGAFRVDAVPLVPDAAAMLDRAARAAILLAAPLAFACCVLACLPRSRRRAPVLAHYARLAALGAGLAALACWRLVWAYRIDVLRDLSHVGARLADNELAIA
ncbi:MAG TPA: hypothetical protein VMJ10_30255, partial [Kofleriaceae bacterium]|nr:hypothetical protein [Kofleriaceae bacterium]